MGLSLGAPTSIGAASAEPAVGALVIDSSFAELTPSRLPKPGFSRIVFMVKLTMPNQKSSPKKVVDFF